MQTTIDFLRHGEVAGGSYYRGSTDDPLTKIGWQQMRNAVLKRSWDQIVCSPLLRCQGFGQYLHEQTKIPIETESNWQEYDFGDWEGKMAEQINRDELIQFYQNPLTHPPKNAEQYTHFQSRVEKAWKNLLQTYSGQHVLVITHGGIIRTLYPLLLGLPVEKIFNLQVDHASITQFQCVHDAQNHFISLIFHNLTNT